MMNRKLAVITAAAAVGLAGCNPQDLTRYNINPNDPTTAPAPALFTDAARNTVDSFLGDDNDERGFELMAQHLAEVGYPQTDNYTRLQSSYTNNLFNSVYVTELEDFQKVITGSKPDGIVGYWAPAAILQTWTFANMTDLWGDIPYSGALMGDSLALDSVAIQPPYDTQQSIYDGMFETLDEASAAISTAPANALDLGQADPIYEGDLAAWQRFSNSLRARLAMRIVNVDPAKADAELTAAFNAPGGVFTSNDDNALFPWPGDGVYDNPWSVNFQTRDDHRVSDRMMTYLAGWDDPRLPIYAMPIEGTDDDYGGAPNALSQDSALSFANIASRPGAIFYSGTTSYGTFGGAGASYPSYVMTYAEVAFIQAEAANRGLGGLSPAQAEDFYNDGIRASMDQWGVTDAKAVDAYLAQPEVAYKGGVEGLKQIYTQKWLALYSDGLQAWSLWRRTCYPASIHAGPTTIIPGILRRFEYGTTELTVNPNVKAAIERQGPDDLTTRMWWDSAPESAPTFFSGCGDKP